MRLTIDPRELRAALTIARRIILRRTTLPVLECVRLTASADGSLTVESTNLEALAVRTVPCIVAQPGAVCVPAADLFSVLAAFRRKVCLELIERPTAVRLTGDGIDLAIPSIAGTELPATPDGGEERGSLIVNAQTFRHAIEAAIRSAAPDDTRPVLAGIHISAGENRLTIASADGFRMRVQTVESWPGSLSVLVPWRQLSVAVRSFRPTDTVTLRAFDQWLTLTAPGGYWTLRTTEGQFPDFKRIIPKRSEIVTRITLAADDLRRVAQLAVALKRDYHYLLRLDVGESLTIEISSAEGPRGTLKIDADISGQAMQLALNAKYLRDALAEFSDRVTIELVGPVAPVTIRSASNNGPRHYVMPAHAGR